MSELIDGGTLATMRSQRVLRSLAVACLAVGVSVGIPSLVPSDSTNPALQLSLEIFSIELFLGLAALAGGMLSKRGAVARLDLGPIRLPRSLLALLVLGMLGLSHGLDGLIEVLDLRERSALAGFDDALANARGGTLWLALLGIGVAPGIAEELLCRGLVQRGLVPILGVAPAIGVAALFFGALHLEPVHAGFAAVLGLYLGVAAQLGGSVRAAILCHVINNLVAVSITAWAGSTLISPASTLAGFCVAAGCLWRVWRRRPAPQPRPALPGEPAGLQPRQGSDDP
jgi:membrane protease YdiL (CAAX protease family)